MRINIEETTKGKQILHHLQNNYTPETHQQIQKLRELLRIKAAYETLLILQTTNQPLRPTHITRTLQNAGENIKQSGLGPAINYLKLHHLIQETQTPAEERNEQVQAYTLTRESRKLLKELKPINDNLN